MVPVRLIPHFANHDGLKTLQAPNREPEAYAIEPNDGKSEGIVLKQRASTYRVGPGQAGARSRTRRERGARRFDGRAR